MKESEALEYIEIDLKRYRRHMSGIVDEAILNDDEALASYMEDEEKAKDLKKPSSRLQESLKVLRKNGKFKKK